MKKIFIIGLPRTGTTSISVALLNYGLKVAHTAYTKHAFVLADVVSDAPCFCDYQKLDKIFHESKFVYLDRSMEKWVPSAQMLLKKMMPELAVKSGYLHPILKRSFHTTFSLSVTNPLTESHLVECYFKHQQEVLAYFSDRSDFLKIDLSHKESLRLLLNFLNIQDEENNEFPHLNIGKQVDGWKEVKHPNKINPLSAGKDHRKFFYYI